MAKSELFDRGGKKAGWTRLATWHARLIDPRGDRGPQAELRRCRTPDEVLVTKAFQRVWASLGVFKDDGQPDIKFALRLALACGVLAHVKQDDKANDHFASLLGQGRSGGSEPRMSLPRLQRLLAVEASEQDKLMAGLIRAVRMADGTADVKSLARSAMFWDDATRRDWTFRYYGAFIPPSGSTSDDTSGE